MAKISPLEKAGIGAAYGLYNVGLSVPVGIVRGAIAIYYLAKEFFTKVFTKIKSNFQGKEKEYAFNAAKKEIDQRPTENVFDKAENLLDKGLLYMDHSIDKGLDKAKGPLNKVKGRTEKAVNKVQNFIRGDSKVSTTWEKQALRAVFEVFTPVIGPIVLSCFDYRDWNKNHDIIGLQSLNDLWDYELNR